MERQYETDRGTIHYWVHKVSNAHKSLIFLPGLTADHTLFEKQVEWFSDKYNVFVWDAPGHGLSRPFLLTGSLNDKAQWLHGILEREELPDCILVGQSMGGYVAQAYMELFPDMAAGFISIDSCPLQREYVTAAEIWMLRHVDPIYRAFPWMLLQRVGADGCAITDYGRELMCRMTQQYTKDEYCALAAHGYRLLADAYAADLSYKIVCPALLLCGEKDMAGSAKRYNKAWSKKTGFRLEWIRGAGHNANTDQPETVNALIEEFAEKECG